MEEEPPGTYDICAECGWEDDCVQFKNPERRGGANGWSLRQAQQAYEQFGSAMGPKHPARAELARSDEEGGPGVLRRAGEDVELT